MTEENRPSGDNTQTYVAKLLHETREELARADQKAATILAAVGVVAAIVVSATVGHADLAGLSMKLKVGLGLLAAVQAWGLYQLGSAVFPQVGTAREGKLEYYGDLDDKMSQQDLRQLAENLAADPIARDLGQAAAVGSIVKKKYKHVRHGMLASGAVALALATAVSYARLHG